MNGRNLTVAAVVFLILACFVTVLSVSDSDADSSNNIMITMDDVDFQQPEWTEDYITISEIHGNLEGWSVHFKQDFATMDSVVTIDSLCVENDIVVTVGDGVKNKFSLTINDKSGTDPHSGEVRTIDIKCGTVGFWRLTVNSTYIEKVPYGLPSVPVVLHGQENSERKFLSDEGDFKNVMVTLDAKKWNYDEGSKGRMFLDNVMLMCNSANAVDIYVTMIECSGHYVMINNDASPQGSPLPNIHVEDYIAAKGDGSGLLQISANIDCEGVWENYISGWDGFDIEASFVDMGYATLRVEDVGNFNINNIEDGSAWNIEYLRVYDVNTFNFMGLPMSLNGFSFIADMTGEYSSIGLYDVELNFSVVEIEAKSLTMCDLNVKDDNDSPEVEIEVNEFYLNGTIWMENVDEGDQATIYIRASQVEFGEDSNIYAHKDGDGKSCSITISGATIYGELDEITGDVVYFNDVVFGDTDDEDALVCIFGVEGSEGVYFNNVSGAVDFVTDKHTEAIVSEELIQFNGCVDLTINSTWNVEDKDCVLLKSGTISLIDSEITLTSQFGEDVEKSGKSFLMDTRDGKGIIELGSIYGEDLEFYKGSFPKKEFVFGETNAISGSYAVATSIVPVPHDDESVKDNTMLALMIGILVVVIILSMLAVLLVKRNR